MWVLAASNALVCLVSRYIGLEDAILSGLIRKRLGTGVCGCFVSRNESVSVDRKELLEASRDLPFNLNFIFMLGVGWRESGVGRWCNTEELQKRANIAVNLV